MNGNPPLSGLDRGGTVILGLKETLSIWNQASFWCPLPTHSQPRVIHPGQYPTVRLDAKGMHLYFVKQEKGNQERDGEQGKPDSCLHIGILRQVGDRKPYRQQLTIQISTPLKLSVLTTLSKLDPQWMCPLLYRTSLDGSFHSKASSAVRQPQNVLCDLGKLFLLKLFASVSSSLKWVYISICLIAIL